MARDLVPRPDRPVDRPDQDEMPRPYMPTVVSERPEWLDIVPPYEPNITDDGRETLSFSMVFAFAVSPLRALAVGILKVTYTSFRTFLVLVTIGLLVWLVFAYLR